MNKILVIAALAALCACSKQPQAPAPTPQPTEISTEGSLSPPEEGDFKAAYAAACPEAPEVSTAICKSLGLGKDGFTCDFGLGKDTYPRNTTTISPAEGKWAIDDSEKACAAIGA